MKRTSLTMSLATAAALFVIGLAHAEMVTFEYQTKEPTPFSKGGITVSFGFAFKSDATAELGVPTTLGVHKAVTTGSTGGQTVTFDNPFDLRIYLSELPLDPSRIFKFDFVGHLNGSLSADSSSLKLTFPTEPVVAQLGGHLYSLRAGSIDIPAPGAPGVDVPVELTVTAAQAPEPSALALAGAGVVGLAARGWLARRRPRPAA